MPVSQYQALQRPVVPCNELHASPSDHPNYRRFCLQHLIYYIYEVCHQVANFFTIPTAALPDLTVI